MKNIISLLIVSGFAVIFAAGCGDSKLDDAKKKCNEVTEEKACPKTDLGNDLKDYQCKYDDTLEEGKKCTAEKKK